MDVSEFVRKNKIHNRKELYGLSECRRGEGDTDLGVWILSKNGEKQIDDVISKTWSMDGAANDIARENCTRLEILQNASGYLNDLLTNGRGKWRNLMIL